MLVRPCVRPSVCFVDVVLDHQSSDIYGAGFSPFKQVLYDRHSLVHVFHVFHAIATEQIDSNSAYRRKKASTLSVDWHTTFLPNTPDNEVHTSFVHTSRMSKAFIESF